jgi:dephospho-CoA kinase
VLRVGLTGGVASGKSTIADMFVELGAQLIDTDVIAREVVMPGTAGLAAVVDRFGPEMLMPDGTLNRRRLREEVFSDAQSRQDLEAILHPLIGNEVRRQAGQTKGPYQLIVIPLLVGSPLRALLDRILVVDCDEATQLERLLARDTESIDQAKNMIAAQASREERLSVADDVIRNDGSLDEARGQVDELHQRYVALAREDSTASTR